MSGTVIVGVIIALMFIVSFSQWFYHLLAGFDAIVLHDIFFWYRAVSWGIGALFFMASAFWMIALTQECPTTKEPRVGIFRYLNCDFYYSARASLARLGIYIPTPSSAEDALQ